MSREREAGVVLVTVLVVLALGSGLVVLMLAEQERGLRRVRLAANMAQAEALALGAEASVLVALRRDLADAPETDHLAEAWSDSLQEETVLETGRFSVTVADANARFDLNRLVAREVTDMEVFTRLAESAGTPPDSVPRILAALVFGGPVGTLDELEARGIDPAAIEALRSVAGALPVKGQVNFNTAGPEVMAAVLGNAGAAARLLRLRAQAGVLTPGDLDDAGVLRPPATGFTSDVWDVSVVAETDGAIARLQSRIVRNRLSGRRDVAVIERRYGPESRIPLPLPDRME